jgi:hypothetical protein
MEKETDMKRIAITSAAALFLVVGFGLIPVLSQEKSKEGEIDFAKVHEEYMKLHTPGKEHQLLQSWAGEYSIKGKMWMEPGKDPMEVHGWSNIRAVGTAFAHEKFTIVMPDNSKMWGEGFFGFDNESKTFQTTWIGGWSTTQRTLSGTLDPKTQVMEFKCQYQCPITLKKINERINSTNNADGTMTMRMYMQLEGMPEMQSGEFVYTPLK